MNFLKATYLFTLAASVAAPVSTAYALNSSYSIGDSFSSLSGAHTIDFGVSPINNAGVVSGSLPSGTLGGVQYDYERGGLYNYDSSSSLPNGISARPVGSSGNYWSVGQSPAAQTGPGIVNFNTGINYFGFLWGSPDAYNHVAFYNDNQLLGSFDGSAVLKPPNGDQTYSAYFNVFADPGESITKVTFTSYYNAFETDNHAIMAPVPEPEIYGMMAVGIGIMGWATRRQKKIHALPV